VKSRFVTSLVAFEKKDDSGAILRRDFSYYSERMGMKITVPKGFDTDFASVPRWLIVSYSLFGGTAKWAAVIHDYLYRSCPLCISRDDADEVLVEAMEVCGIPKWKRTAIWAGVRVGGASSYKPYETKAEAL